METPAKKTVKAKQWSFFTEYIPAAPLKAKKMPGVDFDQLFKEIRESGVSSLVQLARDTENKNNDIALFYLGKYYWEIGKFDDAKNTWQELVDGNWFEKSAPSPWVNEAKTKLQQLAK